MVFVSALEALAVIVATRRMQRHRISRVGYCARVNNGRISKYYACDMLAGKLGKFPVASENI